MAADEGAHTPGRIVLVGNAESYRLSAFLAAADRLRLTAILAVDVETPATHGRERIQIDISQPEPAIRDVVAFARQHPADAVIAIDDSGVIVANRSAELLGLPFNSIHAVVAAENKHTMRTLFAAAGLPSPPFRLFACSADEQAIAATVDYPVVVKPLCMSASRGVIRADNPAEFVVAFGRLRALLESVSPTSECDGILVEQYLPGFEIEVEGILRNGDLKMLAILDKPDPLEGPFFEETILVTPSRLPAETQRAAIACTAHAAAALGLRTGPIHAELRVHEGQPWLLEMAPRSIGGQCSKALVFDQTTTLEELILRHAVGLDIGSSTQREEARGVMMIPIPRSGVLERVEGVEAAHAVPSIEGVTISIPAGHRVVSLPEGSCYLGFIFAKASTADEVEQALRSAHARLHFEIKDEERVAVRIF